MNSAQQPELIPQARLIASQWEEASALLEQAVRVGRTTPEMYYMLAMCYKRDGKLSEARDTLRKIKEPDANVMLQFGLLSFDDHQYAQAADEFQRSLELDGTSYAANYNLMLCRLCLGDMDKCVKMLPDLAALAPNEKEKQFVQVIGQLVEQHRSHSKYPTQPSSADSNQGNGDAAHLKDGLSDMNEAEEDRLLRLLGGIREFDAAYPLLQTLAFCRPQSVQVQRTYLELSLLHAKHLADRCQWREADQLLNTLLRTAESFSATGDANSNTLRLTLYNLHGCCACMLQDFDRAVGFFSAALKLTTQTIWLYQNLAVTYEYMNRLDYAESYWNHYYDLLEQSVANAEAGATGYFETLGFHGLNRLADLYSKEERLSSALNFLQRAHRFRPRDVETLDRLFQLYVQIRRPDDARRTLYKMREIRPDEPQFDLYELDLRDVRSLEDLDKVLGDIKRILSRHPGNMTVEERALNMVVNCLPLIGQKSDQLSEQLSHIVKQVRRLPSHQIDWPVVHDEMHFLRHEFQKLRRLSNKCLALVTSEDHRRVIRDINAEIDQKIDLCISMGG